MKSFRFASVGAVVVVIAALVSSARAATACKADVRATAKSDMVSDVAITKVFAVDVDTHEACAKVDVDLVVKERLFDGEEISSTRRLSFKASNQTSTHKVNHRIARDSTLVDWKFNVSRCVVCGTE